ncbi:Ribokinase-like protein [Artomyces pyxidatus]|uniref:Ribokinase-like protein n=1 Tax=Artomyces pyxidatus TaxID=48021 RepID=A0ACB8TKW9_9AGAM|nr:Ribokinase-like protein [Artomyces pyxidatus]
MPARQFVTLGMFIIDQFSFQDDNGSPTGQSLAPQIGGGGTYASIGARIWLPAHELGMIVDQGHDFPEDIETTLRSYGDEMWWFRRQPGLETTRALNFYRGDHRGFQYLTPRVRITPRDLTDTPLAFPATLHFICSPSRAAVIASEIKEISSWAPITIYEPIPDRCVPEELPALVDVLPSINILSPNAEEALSLLSIPLPPTKNTIEEACAKFLELGVGPEGNGWVIIRSGSMGAYAASKHRVGGWVDAFWNDAAQVVDVTGAGNAFLGGLAAGFVLTKGDVFKALFYASVSASYTIQQQGLPTCSRSEAGEWNGDSPWARLRELEERHAKRSTKDD